MSYAQMESHPLLRSLLDTATLTSAAAATNTMYGDRALTASPPKLVYSNIVFSRFLTVEREGKKREENQKQGKGIIFRVIMISFIGIIAIWANHEASKGFSVTIINDAGKYSLSGKHFLLFYQSNEKAARIVLNTSRFVENLLYPNENFLRLKKQINGITLRLAPTNFPAIVAVDSPKPHEYLISLSPSVIQTSDNYDAIVSAVLRGVARVWLWDGNGATPQVLLNGMVEYISSLAGFAMTEVRTSGDGATMLRENNEICWYDDYPRRVAGFLSYCDQRNQAEGGGGEVIRRLNEAMRNWWHDGMMDDVLGMAAQHACASYDMVMRRHHPSSSM